MEAKLCFYICNSLVPEVSHLLHSGKHPDVEVKSFPAICSGCTLTDERIMDMVSSEIDHFAKIIVIVSSCRGNTKATHINHYKIEIIQLEQCFEILFSLPAIYHYIKQGNYIVSNGWLRNYDHQIREWGFDGQSAKKFFGESVKQILLLETGLPGDYRQNLEALAEYMGLPFDILPIGNSHLQKFIESLIFNWRSENERSKLNERIAKITRESADYTLVFHHLQRLIDHTDEEVIVNDIFILIDLLFAPEQIIYQQIGSNTSIYCFKPDVTAFNFDTDNSFEVEVKHAKELIGTFGIIGVKFPEYIPKYQMMTNIISQMGGLAISNARKYAEIEHAKAEIADSEIRFKTMFTGAPIGIALIDSHSGKILEVNTTFAKIAGRTMEEMIHIDWMQITHPDDLQKDLDNMALLNVGKIAGFQMEKRYLLKNGTFVWINMTIAPIKIEENERPSHLCMIEDITERKKAEETLQKLSQAVEQSPVSIVITDVNGNIEYGNPTVSKITGYSIEELKRKNPRIFSTREKSKEEYKQLWETIKSGEKWQGEFHNRKKNGELYWESALISPIKNSEGKIIHFLAVKEDITEQKRAIEALHDSEARFKSIMKQSPSAIEMYDLNGIQRSVNHAYEELWGFPASHSVNKFNILESEEVKRTGLINYVLRAYNGEAVQVPEYLFDTTGKTEAQGKGRKRWLSTRIYPIKDFNDVVQNIIVTHEDVTVQKEAALSLAESNQKFKNLSTAGIEMLNLNSVEEIYEYLTHSLHQQYPTSVILFSEIDEQKRISTLLKVKGVSQKFIDKARQLTGYEIVNKEFKLTNTHEVYFKSGKFEQISGGLSEFVGPEFSKTIAKMLEKFLQIHQIYTIGITKDEKLLATFHFFNRSKTPITDNEYIESFVRQAGIVVERKLSEEALRKNEAELRELNATKDKFFSIIAHDLRGPFASLVGLSELLAEEVKKLTSDEIEQFAKSLYKTASSSYTLLENLLEWSLLQQGAIKFNDEKIQLKSFMKSCDKSIVEMAIKKGVSFKVIEPEDIEIIADTNMLRTILRNLITNAIKFTEQGGSIEVKAIKTNQQHVLFSVKDTGIGMKPEILENLFRIDTNVSRPGTNGEPSTGLGLILCKEFVEKHGGKIWAESTPYPESINDITCKGSTFFFTIPLLKNE